MCGKPFYQHDVESLFINIPLNESIELTVNYILKNNHNLKLTCNELKQLFLIATAQTHFMFNNSFFVFSESYC